MKTHEKITEEFRNKFFQDKTEERVNGWLAMNTGKLIEGDDTEFCKIATPYDIEAFLTSALTQHDEAIREMIEGMRKYAETQISSSDYVNLQNHLLVQYITGYNQALEDLLEKLNK